MQQSEPILEMNSLLSVRDVAYLLQLSPSTVYRYASLEILPSYKIGSRLRFRNEEINEWLDNNKKKSFLDDITLDDALTNLSPVVIDIAEGGQPVARDMKSRRNYGIGSVYKRKKGKSWVIDYRDENGKRIQKAVPLAETKEEAILALKMEVAKFLEEYYVDVQKKSITFRAMTDRYLQTHAVTKKSYQTDVYRLKRMMDFFKNTELRKIDSSMVREYMALRLREGKTESTVNREIALLKTIFNLAIEAGYLEQNPARRIKKFSESDTVRDRVLNEEENEEQRLFAELAEHVKPVVLTALHTGLRRSKVLGLKWSDVNLSKRFIKVEKTKSGKTRYIPINSLLHEELERLKKRGNNTNRVFPFKSIRTAFYNACARAGIKDFTFHDLRRTFGTRLLENGVDIVTISKLYGHSSVLVTQRYLHPKDKLSVEAVELLAEKPKSPNPSGDNLVTSEEQSNVIH